MAKADDGEAAPEIVGIVGSLALICAWAPDAPGVGDDGAAMLVGAVSLGCAWASDTPGANGEAVARIVGVVALTWAWASEAGRKGDSAGSAEWVLAELTSDTSGVAPTVGSGFSAKDWLPSILRRRRLRSVAGSGVRLSARGEAPRSEGAEGGVGESAIKSVDGDTADGCWGCR